MRTVHWNKIARLDYIDNIDYLLRDWSEKEAQEFIDAVDETEFILMQGNVEFQNTDMPEIKRCVICKQITLFYRIIDKKNIELLRFWNNYQHANKLNL
jgi:plasmid stabilization system protein ParE